MRYQRRRRSPALEVLAANGVETIIQQGDRVTATPVVSHAILVYNRGRKDHFARRHRDHAFAQSAGGWRLQIQPPEWRSGGYRCNQVGRAASERSAARKQYSRQAHYRFRRPSKAATTHEQDYILPYIKDLKNTVDMDAIKHAGLKLGVDPLGGAFAPYWDQVNSIYGLEIEVVNPVIDPTFSFMTVDHDGKIRMDCSSPYAMAEPCSPERQVSGSLRQRSPTPTGMASLRHPPA